MSGAAIRPASLTSRNTTVKYFQIKSSLFVMRALTELTDELSNS